MRQCETRLEERKDEMKAWMTNNKAEKTEMRSNNECRHNG